MSHTRIIIEAQPVMPLDVEQTLHLPPQPCPACKGIGRSWNVALVPPEFATCSTCHGSGTVRAIVRIKYE